MQCDTSTGEHSPAHQSPTQALQKISAAHHQAFTAPIFVPKGATHCELCYLQLMFLELLHLKCWE